MAVLFAHVVLCGIFGCGVRISFELAIADHYVLPDFTIARYMLSWELIAV